MMHGLAELYSICYTHSPRERYFHVSKRSPEVTYDCAYQPSCFSTGSQGTCNSGYVCCHQTCGARCVSASSIHESSAFQVCPNDPLGAVYDCAYEPSCFGSSGVSCHDGQLCCNHTCEGRCVSGSTSSACLSP